MSPLPQRRLAELHQEVAGISQKIAELRRQCAASSDWWPYFDRQIERLKNEQQKLLDEAEGRAPLRATPISDIWLNS